MSRHAPRIWSNGILLLPGGDLRRGHLRVSRGRIEEVLFDERPGRARDDAVDLEGYLVLPGLINAHDHLDFNCFPPCAPNRPYTNVADWFADVRSGESDRTIDSVTTLPLEQRLLAGAFKNLLSGVTTVAHHNPPRRSLHGRKFPVTVPRGMGYCHSLDTEPDPQRTLPREIAHPWVIHAAEGTDRRAAGELARLEALGCLRPGTVLVHCLGIDRAEDPARIARAGAGVVWCPASNRFLYQAVAPVELLRRHARVALGTDAMISGGRGMVDELRAARQAAPFLSPAQLIGMATDRGAGILGLSPAKGVIAPGAEADLACFPLPGAGTDPLEAPFTAPGPALVARGGAPQFGEAAFRPLLQRLGLDPRPVTLEQRELWMPKRIHRLFTRMLSATRGWPPFAGLAGPG